MEIIKVLNSDKKRLDKIQKATGEAYYDIIRRALNSLEGI